MVSVDVLFYIYYAGDGNPPFATADAVDFHRKGCAPSRNGDTRCSGCKSD
jgi:hypothetical protein